MSDQKKSNSGTLKIFLMEWFLVTKKNNIFDISQPF